MYKPFSIFDTKIATNAEDPPPPPGDARQGSTTSVTANVDENSREEAEHEDVTNNLNQLTKDIEDNSDPTGGPTDSPSNQEDELFEDASEEVIEIESTNNTTADDEQVIVDPPQPTKAAGANVGAVQPPDKDEAAQPPDNADIAPPPKNMVEVQAETGEETEKPQSTEAAAPTTAGAEGPTATAGTTETDQSAGGNLSPISTDERQTRKFQTRQKGGTKPGTGTAQSTRPKNYAHENSIPNTLLFKPSKRPENKNIPKKNPSGTPPLQRGGANRFEAGSTTLKPPTKALPTKLTTPENQSTPEAEATTKLYYTAKERQNTEVPKSSVPKPFIPYRAPITSEESVEDDRIDEAYQEALHDMYTATRAFEKEIRHGSAESTQLALMKNRLKINQDNYMTAMGDKRTTAVWRTSDLVQKAASDHHTVVNNMITDVMAEYGPEKRKRAADERTKKLLQDLDYDLPDPTGPPGTRQAPRAETTDIAKMIQDLSKKIDNTAAQPEKTNNEDQRVRDMEAKFKQLEKEAHERRRKSDEDYQNQQLEKEKRRKLSEEEWRRAQQDLKEKGKRDIQEQSDGESKRKAAEVAQMRKANAKQANDLKKQQDEIASLKKKQLDAQKNETTQAKEKPAVQPEETPQEALDFAANEYQKIEDEILSLHEIAFTLGTREGGEQGLLENLIDAEITHKRQSTLLKQSAADLELWDDYKADVEKNTLILEAATKFMQMKIDTTDHGVAQPKELEGQAATRNYFINRHTTPLSEGGQTHDPKRSQDPRENQEGQQFGQRGGGCSPRRGYNNNRNTRNPASTTGGSSTTTQTYSALTQGSTQQENTFDVLQMGVQRATVSWLDIIKARNLQMYYDADVKKEYFEDKLKITKFAGEDFTLWDQFKCSFEIAVNTRRSIPWNQKMIFLKNHLINSAYDLVAWLPATFQGYQQALYLLEKHFDQDEAVLNGLTKQLNQLDTLDVKKPETLFKAQTLIYHLISRMGSVKGIAQVQLQNTIFNAIRFTTRTEWEWDNFVLVRGNGKKTTEVLIKYLEYSNDNQKTRALENAQRAKSDNTAAATFHQRDEDEERMWGDRRATRDTTYARPGAPPTGHTTSQARYTTRTAVPRDFRGHQLEEDDFEFDDTISCATNEESTYTACLYCKFTNHRVFTCHKFVALEPIERFRAIRKTRSCYRCILGKHPRKDCKETNKCGKCDGDHHTLLHLPKRDEDKPEEKRETMADLQKQLRALAAKIERCNVTDSAATEDDDLQPGAGGCPPEATAGPAGASGCSPKETPYQGFPDYPEEGTINLEWAHQIAQMTWEANQAAAQAAPGPSKPAVTRPGQGYQGCSHCKPCSWAEAVNFEPENPWCDNCNPARTDAYNAAMARHDLGTVFGVVPVWVASDKHFTDAVKINMNMDRSSKRTLVTDWLLDRVGADYTPQTQVVRTVIGQTTITNRTGEIYISSVDKKTRFKAKVSTASIPPGIKPTPIAKLKAAFNELKNIQLPEPADRPGVDLLLGLDQLEFQHIPAEIYLGRGKPIVTETLFGTTCVYSPFSSERLEPENEPGDTCATEHEQDDDKDRHLIAETLDRAIEKLFDEDKIGTVYRSHTKKMSVAEMKAMKSLKATTKIRPDGSIEMGIPWRDGEPNLPMNAATAKAIQARMQAKIDKCPELSAALKKTFDEYEKEGIIRKLTKKEEKYGNYVTFFMVTREDKLTTKHRVVFNYAQKFPHQNSRKSLNDAVFTGPKLHNDVVNVLTKFRRHNVALAADIKQMYLRFHMREEDQQYQRFYYNGQAYQFTRWLFGNVASPCAALRALNEHAKTSEHPEVRTAIAESMYVDDFMPSTSKVEEAKRLRANTEEHLLKANLSLCKWVSNSQEVLDEIPKEKQAHDFDIGDDQHAEAGALGLKWNAKQDTLSLAPNTPKEDTVLTKTSILSMLHTTFDPLGIADPITVVGRKVMQKINSMSKRLKISWTTKLELLDDPDMKQAIKEWRMYEKQIAQLCKIQIERVIETDAQAEKAIHIFCDGSRTAKAAVAYMVEKNGDKVRSNFIIARKQLTSLTPRSIPRIELEAATMGAHLSAFLRGIFTGIPVYMWTDNLCALTWIKKAGKQHDKIYVGHKVSEIFDLTHDLEWNHVPTDINPADYATRGFTMKQFEAVLPRWLRGPEFIRTPKGEWPHKEITVTEEEMAALDVPFQRDDIDTVDCMAVDNIEDQEVTHTGQWVATRCTYLAAAADNQVQSAKTMKALLNALECINIDKYSTLGKLAKVLAQIGKLGPQSKKEEMGRKSISYKYTFKTYSVNNTRMIDVLTPEEITRGWIKAVTLHQARDFKDDIEHLIKTKKWRPGSFLEKAHAMFDQRGLLRSLGRLENQAGLPTDVKRPFVVKKASALERMIITQMHLTTGHGGGPDVMVELFNATFTCAAVKQRVLNFVKSCVECQKITKHTQFQIMAALPNRNYGTIQPFSDVAMDFTGHYWAKSDKRRTSVKTYLLIIVCNQTKAVHTELCVGLDTDDFLRAMERVVADRGPIRRIYCDNGSSFTKGKKVAAPQLCRGEEGQLEANLEEEMDLDDDTVMKTVQALDWHKIRTRTGEANITGWKFSPPFCASANGTSEAMVKLMKSNIHQTFKEAVMTVDQLHTAAKKAANFINCRPIGYTTCKTTGDKFALTPNHLLIGRLGSSFAPNISTEAALQLSQRWGEVEEIHAKFVEQWKNQLLPTLHKRQKWATFQQELKIGQLVLMAEFNEKRPNWPMAKVTAVEKSHDGIIRNVTVKAKLTQQGTMKEYRRCIRQLVPLDLICE